MDPLQAVSTFDTSLEPASPFHFGQGIVACLPQYLRGHEFDRCFLVAGAPPLQLFGAGLLDALGRADVPVETIAVPDGERDKNWHTLRRLCEDLTARGVTKDSILLALGGGVVGNVVGLAAGLIYRGIRFVEIPTTVTAQTDSTLSNKQAINGSRGKNQFGIYHAPLFVWADADYPRTEPMRQVQSGIVEGIKNVFISCADPATIDPMLRLWRDGQMPGLLLSLIQSKLRILRQDPSEKAFALALEYGHTFGHAIEWLAEGKLPHGHAVSIGMCLAAELSRAMGFCSERMVAEHYRYLGTELGTPTALPPWMSPHRVYETMLADNKRTGKGLRFLLLEDFGRFVNAKSDMQLAVDRQVVIDVLDKSQKRADTRPAAVQHG